MSKSERPSFMSSPTFLWLAATGLGIYAWQVLGNGWAVAVVVLFLIAVPLGNAAGLLIFGSLRATTAIRLALVLAFAAAIGVAGAGIKTVSGTGLATVR